MIALMAVLAALVLPRWFDALAPDPADALRPLARDWSELRWQAVMAGAPIRVRWFADRWRAERRVREGERRRWRRIAGGGYPEGWRLADAAPRFAGAWDEDGPPPVAEAVFAPTGAFVPLRLRFASADAGVRVALAPLPAPVEVAAAGSGR